MMLMLLRGRLGWTVQRPQRQATERDEQAIQALGSARVAAD
jgi:hypothetical protein